MIDIATIPDDNLSQTLRLMKARFAERGWAAELPYIGSPHCFVNRNDGTEVLHVFSATPPNTSYASASLANDKYGSYELLKTADVPQLDSFLANEHTTFEDQVAFMYTHGKVVVKPVDGGHGKGITVNVDTPEKLKAAIEDALQNKKSIDAAIIQKQYLHETILDVRILCINNEFVAAIWRIPARVTGDGVSTIRRLIENENAREDRGRPYYAKLAEINSEKAASYLGDAIDHIPAIGEEVSVLGIANYGAGGETVDVTVEIPQWLRDVAVRAARVSGLPVAGVDFMLAAQPKPESTQDELQAMLIEINKCPLLAMHDMPTSGTPRNAVGRYVDYLATL
ncbi:MAG: hypothetical protein ACO1N2_02985 [Candidatus Saccharimonadota bacterium]